jgi:hypothetical protein
LVSTTPRPHFPRERPGTHCTGGWLGPRAVLDVCEKSRPHRDSIPGLFSRSQSLYRLNYPAHVSITDQAIFQSSVRYVVHIIGCQKWSASTRVRRSDSSKQDGSSSSSIGHVVSEMPDTGFVPLLSLELLLRLPKLANGQEYICSASRADNIWFHSSQ